MLHIFLPSFLPSSDQPHYLLHPLLMTPITLSVWLSGKCHYTVSILSVHCQYTVGNLSVHCQYTVGTLSVHYQYTFSTLSVHFQCSVSTLLLHCYYNFITLLPYCQKAFTTLSVKSHNFFRVQVQVKIQPVFAGIKITQFVIKKAYGRMQLLYKESKFTRSKRDLRNIYTTYLRHVLEQKPTHIDLKHQQFLTYKNYSKNILNLDTRIYVLPHLSFVRHRQTTPPGFQNGVDWRALVKDLSSQLAKLKE